MSETQTTSTRLTPEPLPANITSVQPGGGVCYQIELAWGRWRRWYLRTFRPGYVRRMAELRHGDATGCPHEVLDPRDLKFCRNLCTADWDAADDAFRGRENIPFARWGLAELQLMGWPLLALTIALVWAACVATGFWSILCWLLAVGSGVVFYLIVYFFRDPVRQVPGAAGLVVSPADGKIAEITRLEHDEFVGGPAVKVGIFLSIFNVHINRAPCAVRVIRLTYKPGKFLNALNPASAWENECLTIAMEEDLPPHRRLIVRQIAGLFARRIVCALRSGERVERGHKFGMIKLGSRTELIVPDEAGLRIDVKVGDKVQAGSSVLAHYEV
jgi:phosphatidylserine decarboxylase